MPVTLVILSNISFVILIYFNQQYLDWDQLNYLNVGMSVAILVFFIFLIYEALRPVKLETPLEEENLPFISLILPIYNEEKHIFDVLTSIIASNYPFEKIELILINDGSTDNTLAEIRRFTDHTNADVKLINFSQNSGKKAGLVAGFKIARNEVILTIDSDTFLLPDSIRKLVGTMDSSIDAICGHTLVKNEKINLLTRLQGYEYLLSHELFKSFEAGYNGVLCCPGCFSAFRKSALMEVIDEFERSVIFNYRVDYGEDRYLTALLLKNNKKVVYTGVAVAYTVVPETLSSFVIQRKRWIKSWFVNTLYLFGLARHKSFIYQVYFYLSFIFNLLIISSIPLFIYFALTLNWNFLLHGLYMVVLYIIFTLLNQGKIRLIMPLIFYVFTLGIYSWLVPLAIGNISDHRWGKRAG